MKLHYFDQDSADADDMMLGMAKMQGYVPAKCLLYGMDVIESPLVQPQPNFRINPDLPMTDGGRRKAQDWCNNFFGMHEVVFVMPKFGALVMNPKTAGLIRLQS